MMTGDELRQAFLRFFQDRGHKVIPSSSLVPHRDPTLLLTSAGMVQIKPYYLGLETPPAPRLVSCQKCFRTTDIDLVGDSKHLTFFEMLGNFSVGDYFKKDTIAWAWEFVTGHLRLPRQRLWITIYLDDDEAFGHWQEIGIPADRILRFGEEDNFWGPVGDSGPCGPCSEIHYDLGEEFGCRKPECKPNCDCGRYTEIWNLVFTQYNQDRQGCRTPLPRPNIDTGMGIERTVAAIQGRSSPYETDLFSPLIDAVCRLSGKEYGLDPNVDRATRIVLDHTRGMPFLIADGVMPSNEGRGYILRRIIRRASLFGRKLGLQGPFLNELGEVVVETMSHIYPELATNQGLITKVIGAEEEKFIATLDSGLTWADRFADGALAQGRKHLAGEEVFRLYDTYGFPPELTAEIALDKGLSIDWEGFQVEMEKQRERARVSLRGTGSLEVRATVIREHTAFVGYQECSCESKILDLVTEKGSVETASEGEAVDIVMDRTPFYAEMGGQVGDTGEIEGPEGRAAVTNTVVTASDVIIHRSRVVAGNISLCDEVEARVDVARRLDIARNHTATHLLQAALRQVLGDRVYQKGSSVEPRGFRFDLSHLSAITEQQLSEIQSQVNEWIRQNLRVQPRLMPYSQAIADGAIALFEEKYGDEVRVLEIGEPPISKELCGGTHVSSTGEIGLFLITGQGSIGAGLHRIEAVTGREAEALVESRLATLKSLSRSVESSMEEVPGKLTELMGELEAERRRALWLERELSRRIVEDLVGSTEQVDGVTVLAARVPALSMPVLRETGDMLRDRLQSAVVVLATVQNGKPSFLAVVTQDLTARGFHAGDIINQVARVAGGGGGGKAGMAQAGGKDAARVDEALQSVKGIVAGKLSGHSGQ
ncbi:MAG: alanine--tRNA ligase [Dehalococcoidia bacterium]|nr:alanine--tRNA ligase [Dehalococcoidia bacterium]